MLTRIRRHQGRHGTDAGFSLAETMVAITIASVVGGLLTAWFIGASDTNTATADSSTATAGARNVLQAWGRYLQLAGSPSAAGTGAGRIRSISPTSIDFYAFLNNSPCSSNTTCGTTAVSEIVLSLSGGNLYERVTPVGSTVPRQWSVCFSILNSGR